MTDGRSAAIEGNRWTRGEGDLAVRVDAADVGRALLRLSRPLVVEEGTRALIFAAGEFKGEVPPGRYDMAGDLPGFLRALNHLTTDQKVTAVLCDAGTFGLDIGPYVVESADGESVRVRGRLSLRVDDPRVLLVNVIKGHRRVTVHAADARAGEPSVEVRLRDELRMTVGGLVRRFKSRELDDAWWSANDFANRLRSAGGGAFAGAGLALDRVEWWEVDGERVGLDRRRAAELRHRADDDAHAGAIEAAERGAGRRDAERRLAEDRSDAGVAHDRARFEADADLREREAANAEADRRRRADRGASDVKLAGEQDAADLAGARTKIATRLRRIETDGRLDELTNDGDLTKAVRAAEHEEGLKGTIRDDELARLRERFAHERNLAAVARRIEAEGVEAEAGRESAWKSLLDDERRRDEQRRRDAERRLAAACDDLERRRVELELRRMDHERDLLEREREHRAGLAERSAELELDAKANDEQHRKARRANELLAQVKQMEADEDEATHRRTMESADAERAERLEAMRVRAGLTPDQLLAMAVEQSPAAAEALGERYRADGRLGREREAWLREQLDDQRRREAEERDRGERSADRQRTDADAAAERLIRVVAEQGDTTRAALEQMGRASSAPRAARSAHFSPPAPPPAVEATFHLSIGDQAYGPYDVTTLRAYAADGRLRPETQVWAASLGGWQPAAEVSALSGLFNSPPPPPPAPPAS